MIKIAAVTENTQSLSSHFGRAPFYRVFTVENGVIIADEQRPKPYHGEHIPGNGHQHNHADMIAPITDCQVLLCGGMGQPAYQNAVAAGLEVILTGGDIQAAVQAYVSKRLVNDPRRVHSPH
jgi:predicted Fe-Mo cluster-binding NifX family protein